MIDSLPTHGGRQRAQDAAMAQVQAAAVLRESPYFKVAEDSRFDDELELKVDLPEDGTEVAVPADRHVVANLQGWSSIGPPASPTGSAAPLSPMPVGMGPTRPTRDRPADLVDWRRGAR